MDRWRSRALRLRASLPDLSGPTAPPSISRLARAALPGLALFVFLAAPPPVNAQQFGRWWWEASVSTGQRSSERSDNGSESKSEHQDLRLNTALNGYLGHPALGRFRLGADFLRSRDGTDTENIGFDADLEVLPTGAYPMHLFARRLAYDFSGGNSATIAGLPDTQTAVGGRFRAMRGPLKGLLLGMDSSRSEFADVALGAEVQQNQLLDWSRAGRSLNHQFRLERRFNEFALSGLEIEDWTLNWNERGRLGEKWRWDMGTIGIKRDASSAAGPRSATDSLRTRNRVVRKLGERNQLDLSSSAAWFQRDGGATVASYSLNAYYRWSPADHLHVSPFVGYGIQSSDDTEVRSPRVGLAASWQHRWNGLHATLTGRGSYGTLKREGPTMTQDESSFAAGLTGTVAHGHSKRLRKGMEFEISRNEQRVTREFVLGLPGLGLPANALGQQNFERVRLSLSHAWDHKGISGWGEWSHRESTNHGSADEFDTDTYTGTLQFNGASYSVTGGAGVNRMANGVTGAEQMSYYSLSAAWQPTRYLNILASYTDDSRDLILVPDVEGSIASIGFKLRAGLLNLAAQAFREESTAANMDRVRQGFSWTVSRTFAGWLPILTGTQRRGVIR